MNNAQYFDIRYTSNSVLDSYLVMNRNWDFEDAQPIKANTVAYAKTIWSIGETYGFRIEHRPMTSGGIGLLFFLDNADVFLDVFINPNNTLDIIQEKGKGIHYSVMKEAENVSLQAIDVALLEIRTQCNIYASYRIENIAPPKSVSKATVSTTTRDQFQLSTMNVLLKTWGTYAPTLQHYMQSQLQGVQSFTL